MGQFLHIGMVYQFAFSKKEFEKNELTLPEITKEIDDAFLVDSKLYNMEIGQDEDYVFTLKKESMDKNFLAFLQFFYTEFYGKSEDYYESILTTLQGKTSEEWIEIAETKSEESYQMSNEFDAIYRLSFDDKPFRPNLKLYFRAITLALEGK